MTDVKLDHPGGQLSMPVREAVEGPGGIDVSSLLKETGFVTLDSGLRQHRVVLVDDHLHRR